MKNKLMKEERKQILFEQTLMLFYKKYLTLLKDLSQINCTPPPLTPDRQLKQQRKKAQEDAKLKLSCEQT